MIFYERLGILGNPSPNSNTATLLDRVLVGAATQGATTTISAGNISVRACQGCNVCIKTGQCIIKDDMQEIYNKIFASPVYMGGITGTLKPIPG